MSRAPSWLQLPTRLAGVVVTMLVAAACGRSAASRDATGQPSGGGTPEVTQLMAKGVGQLYHGGDADSAVATFRLVLSQNPTHYGARFQLARALDRAGEPKEARKLWEAVLIGADSIRDSSTAAAARARLAMPDTVTQEALMKAGLDLLYKRGQADTAAQMFQQVLERNPTHYGAQYQLAVALDKAGKRTDARARWEKVLKLAQGIKDQPTIDVAAARLKERP